MAQIEDLSGSRGHIPCKFQRITADHTRLEPDLLPEKGGSTGPKSRVISGDTSQLFERSAGFLKQLAAGQDREANKEHFARQALALLEQALGLG